MPDPVCARCAKPLPALRYWAIDAEGKTSGQQVCPGCATAREKA